MGYVVPPPPIREAWEKGRKIHPERPWPPPPKGGSAIYMTSGIIQFSAPIVVVSDQFKKCCYCGRQVHESYINPCQGCGAQEWK